MLIFSIRNVAQISDPIITAVAINMINLINRPLPVDNQPCQPTGPIQNAINIDEAIAPHMNGPGRVATITPVLTGKNTCRRIVI